MSEVTHVSVSPWIIWVARFRVTAGFVVAVAAFWLARPSWLSLGAGAGIALLGATLRVWAAGHLEKGLEVTNSGPYRWMRHPLYVGSLLLGIGFSVVSRHPVAVALVIGYLAFALLVVARLEEATLRAKFPGEYDRYARGLADRVQRPFSASRARRNGEYQAVIGFLAAMAVLALKVAFAV
jgi:protein-S-isoprenylcysteine O-methyltransferase Ste14